MITTSPAAAQRSRRLDDGAAVLVRPIQPDDAEQLGRMFQRLSPDTVHLRFFGPVRAPTDAHLTYLATVDHDNRQALIALADGEIVGVARYDRDQTADATRAEVAVVVEDAWQSRGLDTKLLERLANEARRRGVDVLTATVLGENHRMLALARRLAPVITVELDHGEWLLEIPLGTPSARPAEHGPPASRAG